jgi:hypothetical protein
MARLDPRQRGLLGGAWTLGAMAELAAGGVDAVTPGALAGEFALAEGPLLHPIYHVVAGMAAGAGRSVIATRNSDRTRIAALAHEMPGGIRLWLANLTDDRQAVSLPGLASARGAALDETTFAGAASQPNFMREAAQPVGNTLEIGAYGVVCIESER